MSLALSFIIFWNVFTAFHTSSSNFRSHCSAVEEPSIKLRVTERMKNEFLKVKFESNYNRSSRDKFHLRDFRWPRQIHSRRFAWFYSQNYHKWFEWGPQSSWNPSTRTRSWSDDASATLRRPLKINAHEKWRDWSCHGSLKLKVGSLFWGQNLAKSIILKKSFDILKIQKFYFF